MTMSHDAVPMNSYARTARANSHVRSDRAYEFLCEFVKTHERFTVPDLVKAAIDSGLIEEAGQALLGNGQAWGSVMTRARRAGLICAVGWVRNPNPQAHFRPTQQWASRVFLPEKSFTIGAEFVSR